VRQDRGTIVSAPSLHPVMIRGGLWVGFGFAGQQGIAVLRTLVLARLLTPEDFGQVGLVTLTIFAGLMLTEFGLESALVQRADLPPRFVHTAWTVMLIRGAGLLGLLQVIAPWVATAFDRPDMEPLLRVGALSFVLVSLPAVSASLLVRELRYRSRVGLDVSRELSGTAFAIILALEFGTGWALLFGLLLGQAVAMIGVWFLHHYRPRFVLDREALRAYWDFGCHLYLSGLLTYITTRGDDIVVGKLRGLEELGQYQVVFGMAEMLTRGLSEMMNMVVFPVYARIAAEGRSLGKAFDEVWHILLLFLLPIAAIVAVFHAELIGVLLGEQWLSAAVVFALLTGAQALRALAAACGSLILASGRTGYLSRIKVLEVACFLALILPMTGAWGIEGAAACLVIVYIVSLAGHIYGAQQIVPVAGRMLRRSWEPLLVTLLAASLARHLHSTAGVHAALSMLLWVAMWMGYVALRHATLVRKLWDAIPGSRHFNEVRV